MIELLVSLCALCVIFYLTFIWGVVGVGMNEAVTIIGYIVLVLVSVMVFDAIEYIFGDDEDE